MVPVARRHLLGPPIAWSIRCSTGPRETEMTRAPSSPLARELGVVYALLIAYATLHPFTGWRDRGFSPFAWIETSAIDPSRTAVPSLVGGPRLG